MPLQNAYVGAFSNCKVVITVLDDLDAGGSHSWTLPAAIVIQPQFCRRHNTQCSRDFVQASSMACAFCHAGVGWTGGKRYI